MILQLKIFHFKKEVHFLEHKKGSDQFKFTPPAPYDKEGLVFFCPQWQHTLVYKDNNNVSVNFTQFPVNLIDLQVSTLSLVTIDPYYRAANQQL